MVRIGVRVPLGILWLLTLSTGLTKATDNVELVGPTEQLVQWTSPGPVSSSLTVCIKDWPLSTGPSASWSTDASSAKTEAPQLQEKSTDCWNSSLQLKIDTPDGFAGNYTLTVSENEGSVPQTHTIHVIILGHCKGAPDIPLATLQPLEQGGSPAVRHFTCPPHTRSQPT
eukprot:scpid99137/ scgid20082/ 